jgi:hypothetical protein
MKKLLFLFLFLIFISCYKDGTFIEETNVHSKMSIDEDGVVHFAFMPVTAFNRTASDTLCYLYEALRFIIFSSCPDEEDDGIRTRVNTRLRLVKISKLTLQVTPITEWITFNNVGGLNISWYLHPPLEDHWYATQFDYCYRTDNINEHFWLLDFWGDDGMRLHMEPFTAYDVKGCTYAPVSQGDIIVACTLNRDCTISE